jgi:hypothetical protein
MPDKRNKLQKKIDAAFGMPLYYCSECMLAVDVKDGVITRPCEETCTAQIFAPRKAIACGEGGLSFKDKTKTFYWRLAAALTGRCV